MFKKVVFPVENNKKSQAELYREERKARLAKEAAKKAKSNPKKVKTKQLIKKVIAVVLAVVIGLGAVYGVLSFFDVPEKVIKVSFKSADGEMTYKMSAGEFNYYYFTTWMNFYQQAIQYEQYMGQGAGLAYTGYDYTKSPSEQPLTAEIAARVGVTLEEIGNTENPTWADALTYSAINTYVSVKYGSEMAKKNNITISEEKQTYIDGTIHELKTTAAQQDFSVNRFLRTQYGKGVTEKIVRTALEDEVLSAAYYESLEADITSKVTADDIAAEYDANKNNYNIVDLRLYKLTTSMDEGEHADLSEEEHDKKHEELFAATKARADKIFEKITDEKSFINAVFADIREQDEKSEKTLEDVDKDTLSERKTYANLSSNTEELAKWVYDEARQVGDKTVIDNGSGTYFVVMIKALPYKDIDFASVDVRHILIKFPEAEKDDKGQALPITDEQKAETKKTAQKVLDEYKANPTVENFIELTKKHTGDVDSLGKPNNDGLYENVANDGQYVESFALWSVNGERKPGDTDIVETDYGYHIMYFVEANDTTTKWESDIKTKIINDRYTALGEEIIKNQTSAIKYNSGLINWMEKNANKSINNRLVANKR